MRKATTEPLLPLLPMLEIVQASGIDFEYPNPDHLSSGPTSQTFRSALMDFFVEPLLPSTTLNRIAVLGNNAVAHLRINNDVYGDAAEIGNHHSREISLTMFRDEPVVVTPLSVWGMVEFTLEEQYSAKSGEITGFSGMNVGCTIEGPALTRDGKNYGEIHAIHSAVHNRDALLAFQIGASVAQSLDPDSFID